ncbi:UNVERIFIED_CONTAM: hypothetical protein FKN15_005154 [Acipenser sinensis]
MEFAELIKTPRVDNVVLHRPFMSRVEGTLCLTGHHLILSSRQDSNEELWLLHSNIDSIEKRWCLSLTYLLYNASVRCLGPDPNPIYFQVMMRSGQPLTGSNGRRCKEDEQLINATLRAGKRGYIIDTRSINVAQQAKARGGGFELEAHYPQWRRIHKTIERSNILQESLIKLVEACNDQSHNMDRWLSKLEASNWLTNIKEILTTACLAAQCIDREGASVLVHGTEGTDSTLQVTSLAQIILDPTSRTILGFESLVEREWLQAGHPFQQRCSQSAYSNSKPKGEAPVFLLFLDCVWQILRQFPCSFQFNEHFLILLFEHAYASQFGTFLGNNSFERGKLKLPQKTVSLWSWMNRPQDTERFLNPLFEANSLVIWPSVSPQSLLLWEVDSSILQMSTYFYLHKCSN